MGSGKSAWGDYSNSDALREATFDEARRQAAIAEASAVLGELLAQFNDRDTELVSERLNQLSAALGEDIAGIDKLLFGGSVAKHTYVDGLSDIDSLVLIDRDGNLNRPPRAIREEFADAVRAHLPVSDIDSVEVGAMAVTVTYRDGMEIQLLPAIRRNDGFAISNPSGTEWTEIAPRRFADKLTQLNQSLGGRVVPAAKLAKSLLASQIPEEWRPSGYHVESLCVRAFESYGGGRNLPEMLTHLFEASSTLVRSPLPDITGQSTVVDANLGPAGSPERRRLASTLSRIARRLETATSTQEWERLFDDM